MNETKPSPGTGNWLLLVAALLAIPAAIAGFMALNDDDGDQGATATSPTPSETVSPAPDPTPTPTPTSEVTATPVPTATAEPTPTSEPTPTPEPAPTSAPGPEPTPDEPDQGTDGVADGTRSDPGVAVPDNAPAGVEHSLQQADQGEVVESQAVVLAGQIFLFGAVPDQASAQRIVELAGKILGPDNVYNLYVIDSRAASADDGNIRVDDTVLFETNSAVIAEEFFPLLNQAVALMTIRPEITMTVIGHTDSVGSKKYNLALSQRRAASVAVYLADSGIDAARVTALGKGETEPVASNDTEEGQQLNRRIQVTLENVLSAG